MEGGRSKEKEGIAFVGCRKMLERGDDMAYGARHAEIVLKQFRRQAPVRYQTCI